MSKISIQLEKATALHKVFVICDAEDIVKLSLHRIIGSSPGLQVILTNEKNQPLFNETLSNAKDLIDFIAKRKEYAATGPCPEMIRYDELFSLILDDATHLITKIC